MRRGVFVALIVLIVGLGVGVVLATRPSARAAGTGPTITVGTPSLVSGKVQVPIQTTGSGFDPYLGFNVHLRWDPAVFTFSSASNTGTILAQPFCPPAAADGDGGGVAWGCTALGGSSTTTGLLGTLILTPAASGCSALHLFTFGGPDGGTATTGTYTIAEDFTPQSNTYQDGAANVAGNTCTPAGPPTSTPTPSNTPTPSATPTATLTPTPTRTPITGAPDVVVQLSGLPPVVDSGGTISYVAASANHGTQGAINVTLALTLPPGGVLTSGSACRTYIAPSYYCNVPNLAADNGAPGGPDESTMILSGRASYRFNPAIESTLGRIDATNEPLANQGNNESIAQVQVNGCPDFDGDGVITILDLNMIGLRYGKSVGDPGYVPEMDQDGDGTITITDISAVGAQYLRYCYATDSDHDGLSDREETAIFGTNPNLADTDGDGVPDGVEVLSFGSNPNNPDTDGDGYTDGQEVAIGKNPVIYCSIMAADIDHDGSVTILDLNMAALRYLSTSGDPNFLPAADVDHDGAITILDLNFMARRYLQSIQACP